MGKCIRNHYFLAFFTTLVISAGLLITSFFMPPKGAIDPSVLKATSIVFLWPALAFATKALDEGREARITHGKTTFVVGKNKDEVVEEDGTDDSEEISEG